MGAYGSPELYPKEPQKPYSPYSQYPQYQYKPKSHGVAFFFGGFVVGAVIVMVLTYSGKSSPSGKTIPTQAIPSASYSVPSAASVPVDSQEYMKNWAESSVAKCLIYPDSALFPENDTEWTISHQGAVCTVSSVVSAKNKDGTIGKSPFIVKIQYYNMYAQITSVQIGDKVAYDITKAK